ADPRMAAAFRAVFRADPADPSSVADAAPLLQTVLFGSWLNEVQTGLDGESRIGILEGLYLSHDYRVYLDHQRHSTGWSADTGVSSCNPLYSMAVTSHTHVIPQEASFAAINVHLESALSESIRQLRRARNGERDCWRSGLLALGSVFHTVEDSAVGATPAAR